MWYTQPLFWIGVCAGVAALVSAVCAGQSLHRRRGWELVLFVSVTLFFGSASAVTLVSYGSTFSLRPRQVPEVIYLRDPTCCSSYNHFPNNRYRT